MTALLRRIRRALRPGSLDRRIAPHVLTALDVRIGVAG